ncbi:MAG: tail fiber domain-containing protein, partial [Muribaculaceae bacterium]|nr:tail fiber domain-containing protein [Muribaculaceae bacterium]
MKKLILLFALGMSLSVNAQLTVFENGNVQVGSENSAYDSSYGTLDVCRIPDGSNNPKDASGSITFGPLYGAKITGNSAMGYLKLLAGYTIELGCSEFYNALIVDGNAFKTTSLFPISAPSFLTTSDARLKTNVQALSDLYAGLNDVNSVSYNLASGESSSSSLMAAKDSATKMSAVDDRMHFGFIAQEVQKIYPNLVVEDEDGMLAIDYTGFIPLLVEAYKDLSKKVKEQEETIVGMSNYSGPHYVPASVGDVIEQKASLKQNKPNPFNTSTMIECTVPESAVSAFICVY